MTSLVIPDFSSLSLGSPVEIRTKICRLEWEMRKALERGELVEREFPVKHEFDGKGNYTRTIFMPAGSLVIGKIHKHSHPYTIEQGRVTVVTEFDGIEEICAVETRIAPAGVKRAIYVHEDTVWSGVHKVSSDDLLLVEEEVIAKKYSDIGMDDPFEIFKLEESKEVKLCG